MPRKLSLGWRSVRFGLTLIQWATLIVGYLFMLNAAIMFALAPGIYGQQFFMYANFGVVILLGLLFLSVLRRAVHIDSDTLREQVIFVAIFFFSWLLTITYPAPTGWILTLLSWLTPLVLFGAACVALVGLFYCLTAIGNPINWVIALAALCTLAASMVLLLHVAQPAWVEPVIPASALKSWLFKFPMLSGVLGGCIGVLLHGIYLRRVADYFNDRSTSEFVTGFLGYHVFASAGLLAALAWLGRHQVQPILEVGGVTLDAVSVSLSAVSSILVAIGTVWLSRCEEGTRNIIDLSRRGG